MRPILALFLLPFAAWFGTLQSLQPMTSADPLKLVSLATLLSTMTVFVYRLGVWRQEMENTKHNVGAELKAYREESTASFARLHRHLEAIDHLMTAEIERHSRAVRWQHRADRRLERLEMATSEVSG